MQVKQTVFYAEIILFSIFIPIAFCGVSDDEQSRLRDALQSAKTVAISITISPDEFVVAVSPVRQTLQIIHSTARLAGALISEVQNENYRKELQKIVGELKGPQSYRDAIWKALKENISAELVEVPPMGSTAKYKTDREAMQDRMRQLRDKNFDLLIDLKISCGIYGPEGEMFFRWNGKIYDLQKEKNLWRSDMILSPSVKFQLNQDFKTYFNPFKSNMFSPRLTLSKHALSRWTDNNGENFRASQDYGIRLAVTSLIGELQLHHSKQVWFAKGVSEIYKHKWKKAVSYFDKAWQEDKMDAVVGNALLLALYKAKRIDEAIEVGEALTQNSNIEPYPHLFYNLAYIYVEKKKDGTKAREAYQKYIELHGIPDAKLEKKIHSWEEKR